MWVNPNHPNPPRQAVPPQEQGARRATFPRGPGVELRACLDEYEGHRYFTLRVWEQGRHDGEWWPTRKGVSVRLSEAHDLARVLAEAARDSFKASNRGRGVGRINRHGVTDNPAPDPGPVVGGVEHYPAAEPTRYVDKGRPRRAPFDASRGPRQTGGGAFDECE